METIIRKIKSKALEHSNVNALTADHRHLLGRIDGSLKRLEELATKHSDNPILFDGYHRNETKKVKTIEALDEFLSLGNFNEQACEIFSKNLSIALKIYEKSDKVDGRVASLLSEAHHPRTYRAFEHHMWIGEPVL